MNTSRSPRPETVIGRANRSEQPVSRAALPEDLSDRILAGAPEAVLVCDRNGTIRFWNAGAERIFGHLAEEARSHTCLSFGSTLSLPDPIAVESAMTGFMLTAPHHWPATPRFRAADRDVALLEAHPLLPSELVAARHCSRDRIQERLTGPQYDVRRPPLL